MVVPRLQADTTLESEAARLQAFIAIEPVGALKGLIPINKAGRPLPGPVQPLAISPPNPRRKSQPGRQGGCPPSQ
jgi:hypothetical protein